MEVTNKDKDFESTKLYQAIKDKNVNEVKDLLNKGEDCLLRNQDGTSYLHAAVQLDAPLEIFKLLLEKADVTVRGCDGKSIIDMIHSNECKYSDEADTAVKEKAKQIILKGDVDKLESLLLSGWTIWPVTATEAKDVSEDLEKFIQKLPEYQAKIEEVHCAIEKDNVRELKNLLDRKKLLHAADKTGLPPLQKAVVLTKMDIINEMIKEFKDAINIQDQMGRTCLHYAGGKQDGGHLYEMLKTAGADDNIKDVNNLTPKDYFEDPLKIDTSALQDKILQMIEKNVSTEQTRQATPCEPVPKKPCNRNRIYVSKECCPRAGEKPSTLDGKYVAEHLGTALTLALAELAERRPKDPIEYLSMWLYKYRENMSFNMKQENLIRELKEAEEMKIKEAEKKEQIKAEQKQLEEQEKQRKIKEEEERKKKEQEELQRKAKEAALAQRPNLETVTEEGEEEAPSKEKDSKGQTELHRLAAQEGADIDALIKMGYSIAERDGQQKTARDVAEDAGKTENVEAIDKYVQDLLKNENFDELEQLVLDGYDKLESVLASITDQSEELKKFASSIPDYQAKIQSVFTAIQNGSLRDVQQTLERKKLAVAKDSMSRCPLHIAVLTENNDIVEHIAKTFPNTVKCKDHMNRTPLHYANGLSNEDIITLLLASDADTTVKDVLKRTPSDYREHCEDIKSMKEKLLPETTQQTETNETTQQQADTTGETTQQQADSTGEATQQQADSTGETTEQK